MIRVLGIDPGSRIMGFGIIEVQSPTQMSYVVSGCIKIKPTLLSERLHTIFEGISQLMREFQPSEISVESVFMHKNAMSALKLGQARGAAIAACAQHAAAVFEYSPREIKKSIVGFGAAEKHQVQTMITHLLQLNAPPPTDAADALAAALCHIYHRRKL